MCVNDHESLQSQRGPRDGQPTVTVTEPACSHCGVRASMISPTLTQPRNVLFQIA